ncbi:MAG: hypothetical protein GY862_34440 [Gammaproteobacteria bacterium]|nr:hypothetical protein [Gammaproteobacteria bacterium]
MNKQQQLERLQMLLALFVQKRLEPCKKTPSDEQMAAFIEGHLDGQEKETVLRYLRSNPEAYQEWLDVTDSLRIAPPLPGSLPWQRWVWPFFHWPSFAGEGDFLSFIKDKRALAGAMALVLAVVIMPLWLLFSEKDLYETTAAMVRQTPRLQTALQAQRFRWESESVGKYGFSGIPEDGDAKKAFGAGLWTGRQLLLGNPVQPLPAEVSPLNEQKQPYTNKQAYFELGRATMLLWTVSRSEQAMPAEFWRTQHAELVRLRQALAEEQSIGWLADALSAVLEKTDEAAASPQQYSQLNEMLNMLMKDLAPVGEEFPL